MKFMPNAGRMFAAIVTSFLAAGTKPVTAAVQTCDQDCVPTVVFNPPSGQNSALCQQGGAFGIQVTVFTVGGECINQGTGCNSACRFDVTVAYVTSVAGQGCDGSTFTLTGAECGTSITPVSGLGLTGVNPVTIYTNSITVNCDATCPAIYTLAEDQTSTNVRVLASLRCSACQ